MDIIVTLCIYHFLIESMCRKKVICTRPLRSTSHFNELITKAYHRQKSYLTKASLGSDFFHIYLYLEICLHFQSPLFFLNSVIILQNTCSYAKRQYVFLSQMDIHNCRCIFEHTLTKV